MSSWKALQAELDQRYLEQGMTLKDFCRLKGINYKTGWRHLISPLSRSPEREWVASPRKAPCRAGYTASRSGSASGAINEHRHRTSRSLRLEKNAAAEG
ncbi:hypothetical protein GCM10023116_08640 [Kistimonas scapharcae]|uniref:Transposase n=1 Tax=Kistimonas scapharcae TaxID=1036133 RepID=A0ABP8UZR8_9GAMM